jgi:hypothetical protein
MKPDWKDAPGWANWLAQDDSGYWYWYENRPVWNGYYFSIKPTSSKFALAVKSKDVCKDSLEKRPTI